MENLSTSRLRTACCRVSSPNSSPSRSAEPARGSASRPASFRYGLAHETVDEIEVLLADGDIVVCTPTNNYSDLFFGFPNSFGTLGYALRIKAKAIRTKKFVE